METLMSQPALVGDHLVLRTATEEAEIDHLRQTATRLFVFESRSLSARILA